MFRYYKRFGDIIVDTEKLREVIRNKFNEVIDKQIKIDIFTWIDIEEELSKAIGCKYLANDERDVYESINEWIETPTWIWKENVVDVVACENEDYRVYIVVEMVRTFIEKDNVRTLIDFSEPKIETVKIERREEM